jgi:ABC-type glycerol-3-phosphate transport system substrate-binding protein
MGETPRRPAAGFRGLSRRWISIAVAVVLGGQVLAACSSGNGGTPTLNFYIYPDNSGAVQAAVDNCTAASGGRYKLKYQKLPNGADGQRQQMVRRLAAEDSSMDILGLDVTWAPEFAEAGWILEWTGDNKAQVTQGTLAGPLETATYQSKLFAAPFNSNTQLLWYRSDLVPTPPKTWDEMIEMASDLGNQGKPHYIEIQGAQYEGVTVWFNTLLVSAGGSVLTEDGTAPSLGQPAVDALTIMKKLATSPGADPSLPVQMENDNRLAMEAGGAAFELNYPFVYPSMKTNKPDLLPNFKWAPYPGVAADKETHVTIGGINIAVSRYTKHPDLAFEAALCLRNRDNQKIGAIKGGVPPSISDLYDDAEVVQAYPFAKDIQASLDTAAVRPLTPAYQNLSIVISHAVSPPAGINPESTAKNMMSDLKDALESKGLVP